MRDRRRSHVGRVSARRPGPWIVSALGLLLGCTEASPTGSDTSEGLEVEWDILPRVAEGEYLRGGFTEVSRVAYGSAVADGKSIRIWVTAEDADEFSAVSPNSTGSGAELARGAIIVREIFGPDNTLESLTVMARSEPGYSPTCGDFWFGTLDADGWPVLDASGEPVIGQQVTACAGCHVSRAADGYLFGVPDFHRNPLLMRNNGASGPTSPW